MSLVTYTRYVAITGDTTSASATVLDRLADAQQLLEEELGRVGYLEDDGVDKNERLVLRSDPTLGYVAYPSATPITDPGDYTQYGAGLASVTPDVSPVLAPLPDPLYATVTYRGGFTPATVPSCIERDIAWTAYQLARPSALAAVPVGATTARLGDAAVTYSEPASASIAGVRWSRATLRHRRRRV